MKTRMELLYHEVARRLLLKQSDAEIVQCTGLKLTTIKSLQEKPEFRAIVQTLREKAYGPIDNTINDRAKNIAEQLQSVAQDSFDRLKALLGSSSEAIVRDVAQDFLDRAGYGKASPTNQTVVNIGSLEASVLVDALKRERDARALLESKDKDVLSLAKPISEYAAERRNNPDPGSPGPTT